MKRIISTILLFCLSFNVLADSASALRQLELELDHYNFAMTVEWDQKDQKFAEEQTQALLKTVKDLIENRKLSTEEIELLMKARIKNPEMRKALTLRASLLGPSPSAQDVIDLLKSTSSEFYQRGASWNGNTEILLYAGVFIAIVAVVIAYSNWHDKNHTCTKYDQAERCVDDFNCRGESCYYSGTYCDIITRCTKEERI